MGHRVIELSETGIFVSRYRGFLVVAKGEDEKGRVPLADISVLIVSGNGCSLSSNLLQALVDNNTPVVLCGKNYVPSGMLLPLAAHHQHAKRLKTQVEAALPLKKRIWQTIVQRKIANQGRVLAHLVGRDFGLEAMAKRVGSGDSKNFEAQASRRYWPKLFGTEFIRDPALPGTNSLLNYGYAVLRAGTARAICAAGLHPALGVHHSNQYNAFSLADDLMEPFRPLVDLVVRQLAEENISELTPEVKGQLAGILGMELQASVGASVLQNCLFRLGQSLADSFSQKSESLDLPFSTLPLSVVATD